jgi:outer membrane protein OmpA-like peptidoglycan-associated protein/Mg-chelatase subunit ChlD
MKKNVFLLSLFLFIFAWMDRSFAYDDLKVETPRHKSKLSFLTLNENKVLVSVLNDENEAILGLQKGDFHITRGPKTAQIVSVEDVTEQRDQGLNIVMVVDNSYSMKMRKAIGPVLAAMDQFLSLVRPIDNVHIITFADPGNAQQAGRARESTRLTMSGDSALLNLSLKESYSDPTDGTYLYDAMQEGLKIIRSMPEKSQKFMVVFSDGEDINSVVKTSDLQLTAAGLQNFTTFAVDYMDKPGLDPFLKSFAEGTGGSIRKARSASDFLPIFKQFSTTIFHRYAVTFRFLEPPTGTLTSEPATVNIEEITMVDSSPLLNYVYFDTGRSEISDRYATFAIEDETEGFAEEKLKDTMEKYHHILNVIGKRLAMNPESRISIVGCNSNTGEEKGRLDLSRSRADAVFSYFRYVWGIDPSRMDVSAQNLPSVPSASRVPEGVIENQRVEIYSDHPAILDTINSTYMLEQCETKELRIVPAIQAQTVIVKWQLKVLGGGKELLTREGKGGLPQAFVFDMESLGGVHNVALMEQITAEIEGQDNEGNVFSVSSATPTKINFIRREERIAQKLESKVIEKYGLILFEFDRADLKDRNQIIVNRVITRMSQLPSAVMNIAGHTDIIGKEDYNIKLSERRASAVYGAMLETGIAVGSQINYEGNGPNNPPYDNNIPEGRALNRTVIITLMYTENGQ